MPSPTDKPQQASLSDTDPAYRYWEIGFTGKTSTFEGGFRPEQPRCDPLEISRGKSSPKQKLPQGIATAMKAIHFEKIALKHSITSYGIIEID